MKRLSETHGVPFELVRHFLARLFDGEWSSSPGQWRSAAIGVVSLFLPAGLLLVREGSLDPHAAAAPPIAGEVSLLTVLLSVTGLIALLEWQSLFPSGRDYLALAALPVRSRQIFAARFLSVLLFTTVVVAALIFLPSLLAPIEFGGGWHFDSAFLHAAAMQAAASALGCFFVFFAILALQGVLLNLLPARLFHSLSAYLQGILTAAFLLAVLYARLPERASWLPPVWFTGLHQTLLSHPDPFFHAMAARALRACAIAFALSLFTYFLAFRRYRRLLLETPARIPAARLWRGTLLPLLARGSSGRDPRREAILTFLSQTLHRSRAHRLLWMVYLGAALAVVLNSSLVDGALFVKSHGLEKAAHFLVLFWPIACSMVLIAGFRHVLSVPCELRANWIFQITESQGRAAWMSAVERFILAYAIAPIYLVLFPVAVYVLGWPLALRMTLLQVLISLAIFELLFYSWQKLPFTCGYIPSGRPIVATLATYFAAICVLAPILSLVVAVSSMVPAIYAIYLLNIGAYWFWFHRRRLEGWGEARLLYEDLPAVVTDLGIKELTYAGIQAQFSARQPGRTSPGHPGHADPQDPDPRPDARLLDRGVHPSEDRGCAPGGGGSALPGAPSPRSPRPAVVGMGSLGEQAPRQVLPAHLAGTRPPRAGIPALEPHDRRHRSHYGTRLMALFRRRQLDRDLEDELAFHLAMLAENPDPSRRFGNLTSIREACREAWMFPTFENFLQDVRYAVRQLSANRAFSLIAALTLSLGIAATTTIYSMCDAVVWKRLDLPHADRLIAIFERVPSNPHLWNAASPADVEDIRAQVPNLASWQVSTVDIVASGGEPLRVEACRVTPNFFDVLETAPLLGRVFPSSDGHTVLLTHRLWRDHFQSDPAVIGRTLRLNDEDYTIAAVMPPKFHFPLEGNDLWLPLALTPAERHARQNPLLFSIARLAPGQTLPRTAAAVDALALRLERAYPATNTNRRFLVWPMRRYLVGDYMAQFIDMMMGAAVFLLLIACVNVANLQFARGTARRREMALRQALGASRWRTAAQLLTESLLLAAAGAAFAVVLAHFALRAIRDGMPAELQHFSERWSDIGLDTNALLYCTAAAVASGILAGLWPALRSSRFHLTDSLKEGAHSVSPRRRLAQSVLLAAEVALAVVLLIGAGLMIRGFHNLLRPDPNADPASVLTFRLDLRAEAHRTPVELTAFFRQLTERLQSLPGVQSVAAVSSLPYSMYPRSTQFAIAGREQPPGNPPTAQFQAVTADYFRTLRIPLLAGRLLDDRDAVVSQQAARLYWPHESPIGREIVVGTATLTVIGIAGDTRANVFDRTPSPVLYVSDTQFPQTGMEIAVRTAANPMSLAAAVRAAVKALDPTQPIASLMTMERMRQNNTIALTYVAAIMGIFGVVALALSSVGVYGMTAYLVSQQTHEIGVRMALGATARAVLGGVFRRGSRPALAGIGIGLLLSFGLARLLAAVIWGVSAADPGAFSAVPLLMLLAAALAIYFPARRAVRIDPVVALRNE